MSSYNFSLQTLSLFSHMTTTLHYPSAHGGNRLVTQIFLQRGGVQFLSRDLHLRCMKRGPSRTSHCNGRVHQRLSVEVTESYKHVPGSPDSAPLAPLEAAGLCNIQHGGKRERGEKNGNRQLSEPIVVKTSFCTVLGDLTLRAGLQPVQGRGGRGSSGCSSCLTGMSLLRTTCCRGVEKVLRPNPGPAGRGL